MARRPATPPWTAIGCNDSCDEVNDVLRWLGDLRRRPGLPGGRGAGHRRQHWVYGRQLRRRQRRHRERRQSRLAATTTLFCDGSETCDAALDCQAGAAPATDDSIGCTDDSCDEVNDVIVNVTACAMTETTAITAPSAMARQQPLLRPATPPWTARPARRRRPTTALGVRTIVATKTTTSS